MKKLMSLFLLVAFSAMAFSTGSAGAAGANESGGAPDQNAAAGFSAGAEDSAKNSKARMTAEDFGRLADALYREKAEKLDRGFDIANWGMWGMFGGLAAGIWSPELGALIGVPGGIAFAAGCYQAFKASSSKSGLAARLKAKYNVDGA